MIEDMPDMRGFEYCKAITALSSYGISDIKCTLTVSPKAKASTHLSGCRVLKQTRTGENSAQLLLCCGIQDNNCEMVV